MHRLPCGTGINVSHQCSKLEHANLLPASHLLLHTHTHTPYRLHHHLSSKIKSYSLFCFGMHPTPFPCMSRKKKGKAEKARKHSYCLLQSLMNYRNPSSGKKGTEVEKRGRRGRGSPAVASCRGIRSE